MNQEKQTELTVEGMTCPSCIMRIKRTLSEVKGVSGDEVKLAEGKVVVRHEGMQADVGRPGVMNESPARCDDEPFERKSS